MEDQRIGRLFPAGGPVPPELVIGRSGDIDEIVRRLREGIHTLLIGARRIGKTTVCEAACARLSDETSLIKIEVPERADSGALLQHILDQCYRTSVTATGFWLFRSARPLIEKTLEEQGVPLDLGELGGEPDQLPVRKVLSLPITLAREREEPVIFFLDELQRVVAYADGEHVLTDLVDLYSGQSDVVVLVDGSDERSLGGLLPQPIHLGKLCDRLSLDPRIPAYMWREALPQRFEDAGLRIDSEVLEAIISFGDGEPYRTMTAARYAALNARKLGSDSVERFEAEEGIAEARRHLDDDL